MGGSNKPEAKFQASPAELGLWVWGSGFRVEASCFELRVRFVGFPIPFIFGAAIKTFRIPFPFLPLKPCTLSSPHAPLRVVLKAPPDYRSRMATQRYSLGSSYGYRIITHRALC